MRRKKLLTRRPAPTSRISDRPISPADITPRRRCVPALTPKRSPPSLSASFTSAREVIKAEDVVDYTKKQDFTERFAKRFGAAMAGALAKVLAQGSFNIR